MHPFLRLLAHAPINRQLLPRQPKALTNLAEGTHRHELSLSLLQFFRAGHSIHVSIHHSRSPTTHNEPYPSSKSHHDRPFPMLLHLNQCNPPQSMALAYTNSSSVGNSARWWSPQ